MSKGPKKPDTGKVKIFKIKDSGKISPMLSDEKMGELPELTSTRAKQIEPGEMGSFPNEISESLEPSIRSELDRLQNQIQNISLGKQKDSISGKNSEVLRKYLELKELEMHDLKEQLKQYRSYVTKASRQLDELTSKNKDLLQQLESQKRREELLQAAVDEGNERFEREKERMRSEYEDKLSSSEKYQGKLQSLKTAREEWKEKVKDDLKKIKLKERELENKYELLRRDTQALLDSKDKHVLELKNKTDRLELDLETLEEKLRKKDMLLNTLGGKKRRLIETFKLAIHMLEEIDRDENAEEASGSEDNPEDPKKETG